MFSWLTSKRDLRFPGQYEPGVNMDTVDELLREYQRGCTPDQLGKLFEKIQSQNTVQHRLVQKLLFERNHLIKINKELNTKNTELERLVERLRTDVSRLTSLKQDACYSQSNYGYGSPALHRRESEEMPQFSPSHHGHHMNWQSSADGTRATVQRFPENIKRKKYRQVFVYLYSPQRDQIPPVSDITSRISEVLIQRDIELISEIIEETPVPEQARPAILLCVNVSRLGTDVSNALKDVRTSEDVAIVVLHHKDVHVLPKLSSEKSLTGAEFQELGAIVDMAFWKEKGLHQCDINQTAVMKLADFLADYAIP